jgi:hypothetical protein
LQYTNCWHTLFQGYQLFLSLAVFEIQFCSVAFTDKLAFTTYVALTLL